MQHRKMPNLGHLRQNFSQSSPPPIQSPLGMQMPTMVESSELSEEIFAALAVELISSGGSMDELPRLAAAARFAAKTFNEKDNNHG